MNHFVEFFNKWMRRLISVNGIIGIFTIISVCIGVIEYVERNGGTFMVIINNKEANPPVNRSVLVFLDQDSVDIAQIGIFPQITNPSKYALQHVLLSYKIISDSADVSYTDYYSVHRLAQGEEIINNDKTLYPKADMPDPFYHFIMKDSVKATVNLRATYTGVDEPFTYHAEVFAKKLFMDDPGERHQAVFNDALEFISNLDLNDIDIYILDKERVESFEKQTIQAIETRVTQIPNAKTGGKSIYQLESDRDELKLASQEKIGTPWYMFVVLVVLSLSSAISLLGISVFWLIRRKIGWVLYLGLLITSFLFTISIYYLMPILNDIFGITSLEMHFWGGYIRIFSGPFTNLISKSFAKKYFETNSTTYELVYFLMWILLFAIVFFLTIYYL